MRVVGVYIVLCNSKKNQQKNVERSKHVEARIGNRTIRASKNTMRLLRVIVMYLEILKNDVITTIERYERRAFRNT